MPPIRLFGNKQFTFIDGLSVAAIPSISSFDSDSSRVVALVSGTFRMRTLLKGPAALLGSLLKAHDMKRITSFLPLFRDILAVIRTKKVLMTFE